MRRLTIFTLAAAFAAVSIGCSTTANTNVTNRTNASNANSNVAVVVNSSNTNMVTMNSNMMSNNRYSSNMTREEYEKNKADYEKDRTGSTIGQGANDSWIWFKTKAALAAVNDLRDSTINVDVSNDVITLRGTVATAAQKTQAETAAKGIEGQKGIKNELKVQAGDSMTNQMTSGNSNMTNANKK